MFDAVAVSIALLLLFTAFWTLQAQTRFFSTRYFLQVATLLVIGVFSFFAVARLVNDEITPVKLVAAFVALVFAIYHTGLGIIKLRESDTRYRWIHKANRAVVSYSMPHERTIVKTDDGVGIQVVKLCAPEGPSETALIICHGAGRSKNALPIVQTASIMATRYDVFTFDFRGHMESGGVFKADGDTEYDLKAVVEHIKREGYKKVAVIGWSIGAWTALLCASRGRPIDAIVAAAPPPYNMSTMFYVRSLERLRMLHIPLLAGVSVIRNMWTTEGDHTLNIEEFVKEVPPIPIMLVYNDYDYTLKVTAEAFDKFYDRLPATKDKLHLPGKGHIFDWPNTYFLWNKMFDWLAQNL
jgi:pimeloyl-ACP methyl ester carboxylesterase